MYALTVFIPIDFAYANGCTENQIPLPDGINCVDTKLAITTTNMSANTDFQFAISAQGTFYIDWGDNTVEIITRNNTIKNTYSHTYTTTGAKTIKFGGVALGYSPNTETAAISFSLQTPTLIETVSGSLGAIFPTLGSANGEQPRFYETFKGCYNLTSIPDNLFSGITGSTDSMFRSTFDRCSQLSTIPSTLFSGITGTAPNLFRSTFYECGALNTIPNGLFSGITGASNSMFKFTFYNTTSLTGFISPELFAGLNGETATDLMQNIFSGSGLMTSCPIGTHQFITGYESSWSGKVACQPDDDYCENATYYDYSMHMCRNCPYGYTADTTNGKKSETECKINCPGGTWTGQYTQLEYIESTGTQYIDTGHLISSSNISGKLTVSAPIVISPNIGDFAGNVDASAGHNTNYKGNSFGLWVVRGNNGSKITISSPSFEVNTLYDIAYNISGTTRTLTINDTTKSGSFVGNIISTNTFKLFSNGCTGGCGDQIFTGRIHKLQLYEQSVAVLDLIPARRDSDGAIGMYDKISGQFFTNAGNDAFLHGSDVTTFGGGTCINVGDGYYAGASTTNFGSVSTRNRCPNNAPTNIPNATSISQCIGTNAIVCNPGNYLAMNTTQCMQCDINSYCPGGEFWFNPTTTQGIFACPSGLYAPIGMWELAQCGRILHIGDNIVYLRNIKKTEPSLNIDIDNDGIPDFFGNMTTSDTVMTNGATKSFKVKYNSQTYSIYDDSVTIGQ